MRHKPTPAEKRLWYYLRDRKLAGAKFRRQYEIERFILDFYSAQESLVVEVDGDSHEYTGEQDLVRQEYLESIGMRVVRVSNDDVMRNLEGVLRWIAQQVIECRKLTQV